MRSPMTEHAVELQEVAWALQSHGRLDEAFIACSEALALIEAAEGSDSPDAANLLNDLADIERERQRYDAALTFAQKAYSIEAALGDRFTGDTAAHIRMTTLSSLGEPSPSGWSRMVKHPKRWQRRATALPSCTNSGVVLPQHINSTNNLCSR